MAAPLSAIGSVRRGGRYNEVGIEVLYLADTQHTALFETSAVYSHSGTISGRKQPPRVMLSVDVNLQHVVDLTSVDVQNALGVSAGELCAPWRLAQEEAFPAQ